jgi:hypothetical protein
MDQSNDISGDGYLLIGGGREFPLRLDWATAMLSEWRRKHPAQFGAHLAEVVTGVPAKAGRSS